MCAIGDLASVFVVNRNGPSLCFLPSGKAPPYKDEPALLPEFHDEHAVCRFDHAISLYILR